MLCTDPLLHLACNFAHVCPPPNANTEHHRHGTTHPRRYACVNLSCFVLSILQSPGFRPKWKHYNWFTALMGFVLCLAIMLVVSWRVS